MQGGGRGRRWKETQWLGDENQQVAAKFSDSAQCQRVDDEKGATPRFVRDFWVEISEN